MHRAAGYALFESLCAIQGYSMSTDHGMYDEGAKERSIEAMAVEKS